MKRRLSGCGESPVRGVAPVLAPHRRPVRPVEKSYSLKEYYRMSSAPISINPAMLRKAATINRDTASDYDNYRARCQAWLADAEAEIVRCNGVVAAPVAQCLPEFFGRVSERTAATADQHTQMGDKLVSAAVGYENTDNDGAAGVMAGGVG
ncbi:type VII secretion target [Mycobacterium avium]|uniref:type VII secretion target n=1 Tax=Mycobacterium avium TaxID=1764 RepID=UPI0014824E10|nr:type VII secretion target [Mycobacterium avium]